AEDGIRDRSVTGVQTRALAISSPFPNAPSRTSDRLLPDYGKLFARPSRQTNAKAPRHVRHLSAHSVSRSSGTSRRRASLEQDARSEERRVGKECGSQSSGESW